MNKTLKKIIIAVACGLSAVGIFFLGFFAYWALLSDNQRAVLSIVKNYEEHYYFEEDNYVDKIADTLLDKYSTYYSKEEYQAIKQQAAGVNVGIGLSFESDTLNVKNVILNGKIIK